MSKSRVTPKVSLDSKDVRRKWDAIKEFSPKIARNVRRGMRGSGDEIIAEQKRILDGPLPRGLAVTRQRLAPVLNKKTGRVSFVKRNVYGEVDVKKPGRSTGLREGIKQGLRTRVVIGKTRTGVKIQTTNAKETGSQFWQAKKFRHPSWGRDPFVDQQGQPYFFKPAYDGARLMSKKISTLVEDAWRELPDDNRRASRRR